MRFFEWVLNSCHPNTHTLLGLWLSRLLTLCAVCVCFQRRDWQVYCVIPVHSQQPHLSKTSWFTSHIPGSLSGFPFLSCFRPPPGCCMDVVSLCLCLSICWFRRLVYIDLWRWLTWLTTQSVSGERTLTQWSIDLFYWSGWGLGLGRLLQCLWKVLTVSFVRYLIFQ